MKLAMVFPGQGSQTVGMLRAYAGLPEVDAVHAEAAATLGTEFVALLDHGPAESLNLTVNTQPAMVTAGYAAYRAWRALGGPVPEIVAGHSLGEYTALVAAGALAFRDCLPLVRFRAQAMQEAVPEGQGAMAAILNLDDEAVRAACSEAAQGEVVQAVNFNAPGQVVIAGHRAAVTRAIEACKARGAKRALPLPVSAPFHSSLMQPAAERLRGYLDNTRVRAPAVPLINNVDVAMPRTVIDKIGDVDTTDKIILTIVAKVNGSGQPPVRNTANLVADPPPQGISPDPLPNNTSTVELAIGESAPGGGGGHAQHLPSTGFAPNLTTLLPPQPAAKAYQSEGSLWLEVPRLHLSMPIVGVPLSGDTWDVTWLSSQAGWLQGTAFPSWSGNSVLTGHVYLSNGLPGPFLNLSTLAWGDQVIVHLGGERYIFEVRTNQVLSPDDMSPLQHETYPWITLLTCKGYNAANNSYASRIAVRAVLVSVEPDGDSRSNIR